MITLGIGTGGIIGIVIGAIVLLIIFWYIATMNQLRQLELKVHEAESGIDVALTKRFDMLSKMLETAKATLNMRRRLWRRSSNGVRVFPTTRRSRTRNNSLAN
ncbi:MAG: hypothetical protein WC251_02340 [Candidatus Izemoplasmatales bacterium]|jgi:hypothetical protein